MEKISPFPHFWRLIYINRPGPITFRVNRETVRSRALGPGPRAGGDGALLVLLGLLMSLRALMIITSCRLPVGTLLVHLLPDLP